MVHIKSLQTLSLITCAEHLCTETHIDGPKYLIRILETCENVAVLNTLRKYFFNCELVFHDDCKLNSLDDRLFNALHSVSTREITTRFGGKLTAEGFKRLLLRCLHVHTMRLSICIDVHTQPCMDTILQAVIHCPLTTLVLDSFRTLSNTHVHMLIKNCPNLTSLKLDDCLELTDEAFLVDADIQLARETTLQAGYQCNEFTCRLSSVDISGQSLSAVAIRHLTSLCGPYLRHISLPKVACTALLYLAGYNLPNSVAILCRSVSEGWLQFVNEGSHDVAVIDLNRELKTIIKTCSQMNNSESTVNAPSNRSADPTVHTCDKTDMPLVQMYQPGVTSLNADRMDVPGNSKYLGVVCLAKFLERNASIKKLGLMWPGLTCDILKNLLPHLCELEEVSLQQSHLLRGPGVAALGTHCRHLTHVNFREVVFFDDESLVPILSLENLTHLNLQAAKITDKSLEMIATNIPSTLQLLDISMCEEITEIGLNILCARLANIRTLVLHNCQVSDITLSLLSENSPLLENLDLHCLQESFNELTNNGVISLARRLTRLRKLDLSWNIFILDEAVQALLRDCPLLEDLHLNGLQITSEVFKPMIIKTEKQTTEECLLKQPPYASEDQCDARLKSQDLGQGHVTVHKRSRTYGSSLKYISLNYCANIEDKIMCEIVGAGGGWLVIEDFFSDNFPSS